MVAGVIEVGESHSVAVPVKRVTVLDSIRAVNLANCLAELVGNATHAQVQCWLETNNSLTLKTSRFLKGRCGMDGVLDLVSVIQDEQPERNIRVADYFNIERAFDSRRKVSYTFTETMVI